jgi:hypothetical protein
MILFVLAVAVWLNALTVNQTLYNITDSTWTRIPNSTTYEGQDMLTLSCTSYDPLRNRIICYGGGHSSRGFENHILVYDLNTLAWIKLYEHDGCSSYTGNSGTGILPSGRPWIAHTYDHHDFIDHLDKLFYFQGTSGGYHPECTDLGYAYVTNTWLYDFKTNIWALKNPPGTAPAPDYSGGSVTSCGIAYDPITQKVYAARKRKTYMYDPNGNIWQELSTTGSSSGYIESNMVTAPDFGKIVQYGGNYPNLDNTTRIFDIGTRTWTVPDPTVNPGARAEIGMAYDTLHKKVAVFGSYYGNDNKIWFYDVSNNTWTGILGKNAPSQTLGSLHYDKVNNVFISVQEVDSYMGLEIWAFKLNNEGFDTSSTSIISINKIANQTVTFDAYPNPFFPATTLHLEFKDRSLNMKIQIYQINGKLVDAFDIQTMPGRTEYKWTAPHGMPAGIYLVKAAADGKIFRKRITLVY